MSARIAVCVDDFGLHRGVDEAVLELAGMHRISAVSCMVGAPTFASSAPVLAPLAERLDAGLHLDLIEHPLDASIRRGLKRWMADSWLGRVDPSQVRAEIDRQLDTFEAAIGRAPAHVDGHQHVHQFPVVREALVAALAARYPRGSKRPWLRSTRPPPASGTKPRVIHALGGTRLERLAKDAGFAMNGRMLGSYGFDANPDAYRDLLALWLAEARDGDMLMCHPAVRGEAGDAIGAARVAEYLVFRSGELEPLFAAMRVGVWRMSELLGAPPQAGRPDLEDAGTSARPPGAPQAGTRSEP